MSPEQQASFKDRVKQQKIAYVGLAGFAHFPQEGDGHCFFRSIADQLENGSHDHYHRDVRLQIMNQVEENLRDNRYREFNRPVYGNFQEYLHKMRTTNGWADTLELQAAADLFQVKVQLLEYKGRNFE